MATSGTMNPEVEVSNHLHVKINKTKDHMHVKFNVGKSKWVNLCINYYLGWWQYDERTMQDLERAFSSSQSTCQLLLAGHLYVVDFNQMIQYRLNNRNVSRRIRRGINLEKRGVAGIRISGSNTGAGSSGGTNSPPPGQSSGPSTRRRRGNSTPGGSQSSSASGHVHTPAAVSSDGGAATESQASHPSTTSSPPIQNDQRVSDSDDESEEDEDYDSDYSDADDDMELGEEEEALIGEDSDERETEDEEDYEARDGARAPTRRSDRSNSSNNQTPPPPSGSIAHGASNNRTYSPNPNGRGSRGARNGRSSGGGRSNNNGATSRSSAPLGYSDSSQSTASSNSNVISPIFFNRCNLEDGVTKTNVVNNNIFLDPQIIGQVNYAVSQTINNLSSPNSSSSTVKITFDRRSQLNQDEYL